MAQLCHYLTVRIAASSGRRVKERVGMDDRIVIGPLFTHAGFQSWFLVCSDKGIIGVRMGLWFAIAANKTATAFTGAAGALLEQAGNSTHAKTLQRLHRLSDAELLAQKAKVLCRAQDLASITLKQKRLSSSEVIVSSRRGERHVFGILNAIDFGKIGDALETKYGAMLTRS
jgi:hypothetical protein